MLWLARPVLRFMRSSLPPISETEREALEAGSVWWDGELFSGKPDWSSLLSADKPQLSEAEQAFLDNEVTELCRMADMWKINHDWQVIPEHIIEYVRHNGFLSLIIPKQYGGRQFSAFAQSEILLRLSNTGGAVTYLVGVPNSLGPGELLIKYGTEAQKNHYLPRLASGQDIPCFALTAPTAGSDATSIPDTGVVCKGQWQGEKVLGIRLNFAKRYITLAPIATLIGLAFRLQDPDGLLGDPKDYGITCALLPRDVPGLQIGRRHLPIGDTFLNGPIQGKDVFVPLDAMIGGVAMAGKGWRMLVNCLSVGRAVTLPTTGVSVAKRALLGTSAYANLRRQFGVRIAQFEGIQKPLARMAGLTYIVDAARRHTIQSLDDGHKPSVPGAILKYHCTEMGRQCLLDAMDIHGGKAVMKGEKNYIASMYESIPVAITVEGANILTRNLMIFGQGATRSHPFILREMQLAQDEDSEQTLREFDKVLTAHLTFSMKNAGRTLLGGFGLYGAKVDTQHAHLKPYYRHVNRLSSAFALTADVSMLSLGATLKFKEMLSARLGDLLSMLYLASMVIKQHEDNDGAAEEWVVVQWSLDHLLHQYQIAFDELMANLPNRGIVFVLKRLVFPFGRRFHAPRDALETDVAALVGKNNATRERLTAGLYLEDVPHNPLAQVNQVFLDSLAIRPLRQRMKKAVKAKQLPKLRGNDLIIAAKSAGVISAAEAQQLQQCEQRLMAIIHVDDFDESELIRTPYHSNENNNITQQWRKAS